jgi:drug/metabolite transporter (DMT)-like permease
MSSFQVAILVLYAFGMSIGQVLFKFAADRMTADTAEGFLSSVLGNGYFLLAFLVYCGLTVLWVWILTRIPLSRAYPFVVLAFVFTPALAFAIFGEPLDLWYLLGLGLVLCGLAVLTWKAA